MKNIFLFYILTFLGVFPFLNQKITKKHNTTLTNIETVVPLCIGDNGKLRMLYWNNVSGLLLDNLYTHPTYPQTPDGMVVIDSLQTPISFNNFYGALVRGYLLAPITDEYHFNITGDRMTAFYLSTNEMPENKNLLVSTPNKTQLMEHDKYVTQTNTIDLIAGNYYYFEIHLKDDEGSDFVKIHWQKGSDTTWTVIEETHLYDYTCDEFCLPLGTPCDDGDASTTNDIEDGFCNCYGRPEGGGACIGEQGEITVMYYDNILGDNIIQMDTSSIFPTHPTRIKKTGLFRIPHASSNLHDNYGTYIRCFLTVPETGDYIFNITGNDETELWLSTGESTEVVDLASIAHIPHWTEEYNHDKYETQTSDTITLTKGQFYYLELKMKEETSLDHFTVWWNRPSDNLGDWTVISGAYLYKYACETACFPVHTFCDDNNPLTVNDRYDGNCNCVGVICENCENDANYLAYDICNLTDRHSNQVDSWLSCETTSNPNPNRNMGHWIMYDLKDLYQIYDTHIWNYNKENQTGKGFKDVVVDVSLDMVNWKHLGDYTWTEASGTTNYEGFEGDNYHGEIAKYVLITGLNNWSNDNCSGFSELKMNVKICPNVNTPCDDNDPSTINDVYDEFCSCKGVLDSTLDLDLISFKAGWNQKNVLITWKVQNELAGTYYEVQRSLNTKDFEAIGLVEGQQKNTYQFADTKGYQFANDLYYRLKIIEDTQKEQFSNIEHLQQTEGEGVLNIQNIQPNPFTDYLQIELLISNTDRKINLLIFNTEGQLIRNLTNKVIPQRSFQVIWDAKNDSGREVEAGIYYLQLTDGIQRIGRRVVKL